MENIRGFARSILLLLSLCNLLISIKALEPEELVSYELPEHSLNHDLFTALKDCDANLVGCIPKVDNITTLCARIANEHAALLLYDRALDIYDDILYFMQKDHVIGKRAAHILSVLSFAQGRTVQV